MVIEYKTNVTVGSISLNTFVNQLNIMQFLDGVKKLEKSEI